MLHSISTVKTNTYYSNKSVAKSGIKNYFSCFLKNINTQ
ncbi:hypothetical protein [Halotia branconii]